MAKNVTKIAEALGATVVGEVPDTGGGALGMSRLAGILRTRLEPGQGRRPGRPSDPGWVIQRKVPMSQETLERLTQLAESISTAERKVSPMQVAAQLLEDGIVNLLCAELLIGQGDGGSPLVSRPTLPRAP